MRPKVSLPGQPQELTLRLTRTERRWLAHAVKQVDGITQGQAVGRVLERLGCQSEELVLLMTVTIGLAEFVRTKINKENP